MTLLCYMHLQQHVMINDLYSLNNNSFVYTIEDDILLIKIDKSILSLTNDL